MTQFRLYVHDGPWAIDEACVYLLLPVVLLFDAKPT